jgi:dihydroxyacetone kinase-like predicted kinase
MAGGGIELDTVLRFVDIAVDALSAAREEIDALNVYPVPDGDTGTNMYLTIAAARDAIREAAMVRYMLVPVSPRWRPSRAGRCSVRAATRG